MKKSRWKNAKLLDRFNNQILDAAITARAIHAAAANDQRLGQLPMPEIVSLWEKATLAWFDQLTRMATSPSIGGPALMLPGRLTAA